MLAIYMLGLVLLIVVCLVDYLVSKDPLLTSDNDSWVLTVLAIQTWPLTLLLGLVYFLFTQLLPWLRVKVQSYLNG